VSLLVIDRMVDDLHTLVTYSSQQPRPFLFVTAEIGSLVARFYTQVYERSDGILGFYVYSNKLVERMENNYLFFVLICPI